MTTIYDLPKPENIALKRSKALSEYIRKEIDNQGGQISFADFMKFALYHPQWGYYNAASFNLGKQGDFITAPEISPLFAKCFAKQCLQIFTQLNNKTVLELGAGTGRFALDFLHELHRNGCEPTNYFIYEISTALRKKQQEFLQSQCMLFERITWLDDLPENFCGTILANEVLDALPVHCFVVTENTIKERHVAWEKDNFIWRESVPTDSQLTDKALQIRDRYQLTNGYASEINLYLPTFIKSLADSLNTGVMLISDYGYGQEEYYHGERRQGTLTCFYQHRHHNNPLVLPGLQDITAHVDFTHVIETAVANDCLLAGYTSQAAFLLACGLLEFAQMEELNISIAEQVSLHQAIKLLTFPTEMGERIKVMALSKNVELSLSGFELQDRRREL